MTPAQDPHTPAIDLLCLSAHTLGQVVVYTPPTNAAPDFRKGRARTGADPRKEGSK